MRDTIFVICNKNDFVLGIDWIVLFLVCIEKLDHFLWFFYLFCSELNIVQLNYSYSKIHIDIVEMEEGVGIC